MKYSHILNTYNCYEEHQTPFQVTGPLSCGQTVLLERVGQVSYLWGSDLIIGTWDCVTIWEDSRTETSPTKALKWEQAGFIGAQEVQGFRSGQQLQHRQQRLKRVRDPERITIDGQKPIFLHVKATGEFKRENGTSWFMFFKYCLDCAPLRKKL